MDAINMYMNWYFYVNYFVILDAFILKIFVSYIGCTKYADDAKVLISFDSPLQCHVLQKYFNNLLKWCFDNDLTLNFRKMK